MEGSAPWSYLNRMNPDVDREATDADDGEAAVRASLVQQLAESETPEQLALRQARRREFYAYLANLSSEQVAMVRRLRVDENYSCRAIAQACYDAWDAAARRSVWFCDERGEGGVEPSNQYIGTELCRAAAERLGQDLSHAPCH